MRSTKETSRQKALTVAIGWEHAEKTAASEAHVRKVLSEILTRNTGQALRTPTVRQWFSEWLDGKHGETKDRYVGISKAFFEHLGTRADRPLAHVTPTDVRNYIKGMEKKASVKTVCLHLQAIKSAFNEARRMQLIECSAADPVSVEVDGEEVERELFTEAEAKLLIDAAEGEWKMLLRIGYYTGLRLMKAATLRWTDINLDGNTIDLRKPGKRGKRIKIPIHQELLRHLTSMDRNGGEDGYVLPKLASIDSGGKRGLSAAFRVIAQNASIDLKEITRPNGRKFCKRSFHSLRHGLVSGLANRGVAPEQRRAITGHKTDSSHARYTHLETETLRTAINKLPSIPE